MSTSSINVHIAEVKVARADQQLHTILGSCIGIGLLWPKQGVYGLAHCLLPRMPESERKKYATEQTAVGTCRRQRLRDASADTISVGQGRYVDNAIETLIDLMNITHFRDIRAVIAGGANMTMPDSAEPEKLVGFLNAQSAIEELTKRRIIVVHDQTGGAIGRKLSLHCNDGSFIVKPIPRQTA